MSYEKIYSDIRSSRQNIDETQSKLSSLKSDIRSKIKETKSSSDRFGDWQKERDRRRSIASKSNKLEKELESINLQEKNLSESKKSLSDYESKVKDYQSRGYSVKSTDGGYSFVKQEKRRVSSSIPEVTQKVFYEKFVDGKWISDGSIVVKNTSIPGIVSKVNKMANYRISNIESLGKSSKAKKYSYKLVTVDTQEEKTPEIIIEKPSVNLSSFDVAPIQVTSRLGKLESSVKDKSGSKTIWEKTGVKDVGITGGTQSEKDLPYTVQGQLKSDPYKDYDVAVSKSQSVITNKFDSSKWKQEVMLDYGDVLRILDYPVDKDYKTITESIEGDITTTRNYLDMAESAIPSLELSIKNINKTISDVESDEKYDEYFKDDRALTKQQYIGELMWERDRLKEQKKELETNIPKAKQTIDELKGLKTNIGMYEEDRYDIELTSKGYNLSFPKPSEVHSWYYGKNKTGENVLLASTAFKKSPFGVKTLISVGLGKITGDKKYIESEKEETAMMSLFDTAYLKSGNTKRYVGRTVFSEAMIEGVYIPAVTLGAGYTISAGASSLSSIVSGSKKVVSVASRFPKTTKLISYSSLGALAYSGSIKEFASGRPVEGIESIFTTSLAIASFGAGMKLASSGVKAVSPVSKSKTSIRNYGIRDSIYKSFDDFDAYMWGRYPRAYGSLKAQTGRVADTFRYARFNVSTGASALKYGATNVYVFGKQAIRDVKDIPGVLKAEVRMRMPQVRSGSLNVVKGGFGDIYRKSSFKIDLFKSDIRSTGLSIRAWGSDTKALGKSVIRFPGELKAEISDDVSRYMWTRYPRASGNLWSSTGKIADKIRYGKFRVTGGRSISQRLTTSNLKKQFDVSISKSKINIIDIKDTKYGKVAKFNLDSKGRYRFVKNKDFVDYIVSGDEGVLFVPKKTGIFNVGKKPFILKKGQGLTIFKGKVYYGKKTKDIVSFGKSTKIGEFDDIVYTRNVGVSTSKSDKILMKGYSRNKIMDLGNVKFKRYGMFLKKSGGKGLFFESGEVVDISKPSLENIGNKFKPKGDVKSGKTILKLEIDTSAIQKSAIDIISTDKNLPLLPSRSSLPLLTGKSTGKVSSILKTSSANVEKVDIGSKSFGGYASAMGFMSLKGLDELEEGIYIDSGKVTISKNKKININKTSLASILKQTSDTKLRTDLRISDIISDVKIEADKMSSKIKTRYDTKLKIEQDVTTKISTKLSTKLKSETKSRLSQTRKSIEAPPTVDFGIVELPKISIPVLFKPETNKPIFSTNNIIEKPKKQKVSFKKSLSVKTVLAQPFKVQTSQAKYGKATHPLPTKSIWLLGEKTGWDIPTVELIEEKKKKKKKKGKSKKREKDSIWRNM